MWKLSSDSIAKNCPLWIEDRKSELQKPKNKVFISFIVFHFLSFSSSRDKNHVTKLLSRFPNLDRNLVQREYPDVDVKAIDYKDKSRGHFAPKID